MRVIMGIELQVIAGNLTYAASGVILALVSMAVGYKLFDWMTPFKTGEELDEGNIAIGIVVGSVFIAIGLAVGLVVGISLV